MDVSSFLGGRFLNQADLPQPIQTWTVENGDITVEAYRNETTGTYYKLESYQLFSVGPDGEQFTDDDITNF